mmetsp:Transcript_30837/g.76989  ORF Transcript_30837/g.76989 Transcript_30837/m.76989 type:complete len:201 (+) Transcript_30837:1444-2046(+)
MLATSDLHRCSCYEGLCQGGLLAAAAASYTSPDPRVRHGRMCLRGVRCTAPRQHRRAESGAFWIRTPYHRTFDPRTVGASRVWRLVGDVVVEAPAACHSGWRRRAVVLRARHCLLPCHRLVLHRHSLPHGVAGSRISAHLGAASRALRRALLAAPLLLMPSPLESDVRHVLRVPQLLSRLPSEDRPIHLEERLHSDDDRG